MTIPLADYDPTPAGGVATLDITKWTQTSYRCLVALVPEEDGTWSAIALGLPGAGSCGDTKDDALSNVREAIKGLIESYSEDNKDIPWCVPNGDDIPSNAELAWIVVNA